MISSILSVLFCAVLFVVFLCFYVVCLYFCLGFNIAFNNFSHIMTDIYGIAYVQASPKSFTSI